MAMTFNDNGSYSTLTFSSGHQVYVCCGVVGLSADGDLKAFDGFDGELDVSPIKTKVSQEDRIELADHMIARLQTARAKWAAKLPPA
jgi:hypothetical protein